MTTSPSWCIPGWDYFFFPPFFYSVSLSFSSHFLQVFLCAFLSFFTSWKGLIPFFFLSCPAAFQNSFHALGLCARWERQHRGVPHLLACYLVSSSIKSTPQILPPPSLSLFVVSPAVAPDEEGLIWGTLVLMWRPECQKWRLCVKVWGPEKRRGPPWHKSIHDVCRPWIVYQLISLPSSNNSGIWSGFCH